MICTGIKVYDPLTGTYELKVTYSELAKVISEMILKNEY